MKKFVYLISIVLVSVISGCASAPRIFIPQVTIIDLPELHQISTVEVGDTLVEKSKLYTYDGLELKSTLTDDGFAREYIMTPHNLRLVKTDKKGNRYYLANAQNYYVNDKTFGQQVPLVNQHLIINHDDTIEFTGYFDLTSAGDIVNKKPNMRIGKVVDVTQTNFKQELLYNGKSNNTVKFMYREFSESLARPSFSQEVQYVLSESKVIGFKGLRIEIIDASNINLTYKVLKSFPDPY
jgi:hypothetical protein